MRRPSDFDDDGTGLAHASDAGLEKQSAGRLAVLVVDDIERSVGVGCGEVECAWDESVLEREQ